MALVKYNNNSISAITSAAAIPSGAMTLIKEVTASSSATVSFVDGASDVVLDSTYPIYLFKFINIHPATDGADFTFNMSVDTGSNYNATKTTTFFNAYHKEDDSATSLAYVAGNDIAQGTGFQIIADAVGNGNDECASGELFLYSPSSTTFIKHFMSNVNGYRSTDWSVNVFASGYANTTSAVDAVQFKFSSGNIDLGSIKLYGIKDS
tara:strand:+ start:149 stop:772 length:624 start_codon:yes stop_codon:yes gene_type:complete